MFGYRFWALSLILSVFSFVAFTGPGVCADFPGGSGMALLDDSHLLIIQDVKRGQDGSAIGALYIDPDGGYSYEEIAVEWPERQVNDLESCFALPDRPGEFLVAESGSYNEVWYDPETELYAGRIYHIRVELTDASWKAEILNTMPVPLELHEVEGMVAISVDEAKPYLEPFSALASSTTLTTGNRNYDNYYRIDSRNTQANYGGSVDVTVTGTAQNAGQQPVVAVVEAEPENGKEDPPAGHPPVPYAPMAYTPAGTEVDCTVTVTSPDTYSRYIIILATRGAASAYEPARLHWGIADLKKGTFDIDVANNLPLYDPHSTPTPWQRGCSDLYLDEAGYIWVSTAADAGDAGPFVSTVYRFGELIAVLQSTGGFLPAYSMLHIGSPDISWEISGVKIEAIGPPVLDGAVLSYATDDEGYGGIWRPLGAAGV